MEVARLRLGIVVGLGLLYEVGLQLVALVHEDGVGNHDFCLLVQVGSLVQHLVAEVVNAVGTRLAEAQHLVYLLLRLARGTVVQQA